MRWFVLLAALSGCTTFAPCERAPRAESPEALVATVRAEVRDEEWSRLYDRLSSKLRERWSRWEFVLGFPHERLPAPRDYRAADVVAKGRFDGALVDPVSGQRAIAYWSYSEPGKPRLDAEVELVREGGEWRIDGVH